MSPQFVLKMKVFEGRHQDRDQSCGRRTCDRLGGRFGFQELDACSSSQKQAGGSCLSKEQLRHGAVFPSYTQLLTGQWNLTIQVSDVLRRSYQTFDDQSRTRKSVEVRWGASSCTAEAVVQVRPSAKKT